MPAQQQQQQQQQQQPIMQRSNPVSMRCEDFPCCGHEAGCCPDFDSSGRQLNMKCVCGAEVPLTSRTSICLTCLEGNRQDLETYYEEEYYPEAYYDD